MELEIFFKGEWLEVLGCGGWRCRSWRRRGWGISAWAFGSGSSASPWCSSTFPTSVCFGPDDTRFTKQPEASMFKAGGVDMQVQAVLQVPALPEGRVVLAAGKRGGRHELLSENNLCEVVRDAAGSLVEEELIDGVRDKKKGLTSGTASASCTAPWSAP